MTRTIPLTRGLVALVDDEDFDMVSAWRWKADGDPPYARRNQVIDGRWKSIRMHRLILPGVEFVDHRNGNTLDNRRSNLRPATNAQNAMNRRRRSDNTSGFKGVTRNKSGRWSARIWRDQRLEQLGSFDTPEQAARTYDIAALATFGEFARTNFPREDYAA